VTNADFCRRWNAVMPRLRRPPNTPLNTVSGPTTVGAVLTHADFSDAGAACARMDAALGEQAFDTSGDGFGFLAILEGAERLVGGGGGARPWLIGAAGLGVGAMVAYLVWG